MVPVPEDLVRAEDLDRLREHYLLFPKSAVKHKEGVPDEASGSTDGPVLDDDGGSGPGR